MERLAPVDALSKFPWTAAAVSLALHGAAALALMTAGLPPRPPAAAPLVVDVIMVSEAPQAGDAADRAGNEGAADAAPPPEIQSRSLPIQAVENSRKARTRAMLLEPRPLPTGIRLQRKPEPPRKPVRIGQARTASEPSRKPLRTEGPKAVRAAKPERSEAARPKVVRLAKGTAAAARRGVPPGGRRIAATFRLGSAENPRPRYPRLARVRGWEGRVVLLVTVDPKGTPATVEVEVSSGFASLDKAAVKAVRRWRFRPARLAGMSVTDTIRIPIRFELSEK